MGRRPAGASRRPRGPGVPSRAIGVVLLLVAAAAMLFVVATVAVATRSGGGPAVGGDGTVGPRVYSLIQPGQRRADVRAVLGTPGRVQVVVEDGGVLDCWIYRRARAPGMWFRFCFDGDVMAKKSAL